MDAKRARNYERKQLGKAGICAAVRNRIGRVFPSHFERRVRGTEMGAKLQMQIPRENKGILLQLFQSQSRWQLRNLRFRSGKLRASPSRQRRRTDAPGYFAEVSRVFGKLARETTRPEVVEAARVGTVFAEAAFAAAALAQTLVDLAPTGTSTSKHFA